jgi:hypothetical protein
MSAILGTLVGFASSFVPPIMDYFKKKEEHKQKIQQSELKISEDRLKHEQNIELLRLQKELDIKASELRINEIEAKADVEQASMLLNHDKTLAEKNQSPFVAALSASVRPIITYVFFATFIAVKLILLYTAIQTGLPLEKAITIIWNEETEMLFSVIISFWFGDRLIRKFK